MLLPLLVVERVRCCEHGADVSVNSTVCHPKSLLEIPKSNGEVHCQCLDCCGMGGLRVPWWVRWLPGLGRLPKPVSEALILRDFDLWWITINRIWLAGKW